MPFNGSGTFVRLYNWTNDAQNNIPISANRFDGEDNDMASGLSLCLTRDGQGVPTQPLTWSQPLTINVASDETVIAAGRTGGTNNPQLQLKVADSTGVTMNLSTAQQLAISIAGTTYLALSGTGALSVNAPSGNAAIGIATGTYTLGNATDNPNYVFAGSGTITLPSGGLSGAGILSAGGFRPTGSTVPANGIYLPSANTLGFATNTAAAGSISSAGAWSLPAANAAVTLAVAGAANQYAQTITASGTSGQSLGLKILAGTTAADFAALITNQSGATQYLAVYGDGEVCFQPPTSVTGMNSGSLYQVGYMEMPLNNQASNYTLALTDRGKFVAVNGNTTIPANGSVAFPVGSTVLVFNNKGVAATISITTDTLLWLPTATTGSRTLAANGVATLYKFAATEWFIWGVGIS